MSHSTIKDNTVDESKEIVTLSDFIDENQKLITVLGVFTALTVFAGNISLAPFRNILSFLFMSLAIIVWIELWRKFPLKKYTWLLRWFEIILTLSIIVLISYWFIGYSEMWQGYLIVALTSIFTAVFGIVHRKLDLYDRLYNSKSSRYKLIKRITWFAFIIIWIGTSTYFAIRYSPSIGKLLNELHQQMNSVKP